MPNKTPIEWTDYSSNPIYAVDVETGKRGWHCVHVSEGCRNCYAEVINKRFGTGLEYKAQNDSKVRFELNEKELNAIRNLSRRCKEKGIKQKVFIGDMLDIFHPSISDDLLNHLFSDCLEVCGSLIFQILTKRSERMRDYLNWRWGEGRIPSRHIHVGVSVEDQPNADRRIPDLLATRAAVRWISAEPLLGAIRLDGGMHRRGEPSPHPKALISRYDRRRSLQTGADFYLGELVSVDWVVVGGESGASARPMNLLWLRGIVDQCKAAGVPVFVKQLGAWPYEHWPSNQEPLRVKQSGKKLYPFLNLESSKGGDINEWPEDLRVREFPAQVSV